jgi:hypothetical protein
MHSHTAFIRGKQIAEEHGGLHTASIHPATDHWPSVGRADVRAHVVDSVVRWPVRLSVRRFCPGASAADRSVQNQEERHVPEERRLRVVLACIHHHLAIHDESEVVLRVLNRKLVVGGAPVAWQGSALVHALVADRVGAVLRWPGRLPVVRAAPVRHTGKFSSATECAASAGTLDKRLRCSVLTPVRSRRPSRGCRSRLHRGHTSSPRASRAPCTQACLAARYCLRDGHHRITVSGQVSSPARQEMDSQQW